MMAKEIFRCLAGYAWEVRNSDMTPASKESYTDHATMFVRWIFGDFSPGADDAPGSNDLTDLQLLIAEGGAYENDVMTWPVGRKPPGRNGWALLEDVVGRHYSPRRGK